MVEQKVYQIEEALLFLQKRKERVKGCTSSCTQPANL